jgi:hypothetical protein
MVTPQRYARLHGLWQLRKYAIEVGGRCGGLPGTVTFGRFAAAAGLVATA